MNRTRIYNARVNHNFLKILNTLSCKSICYETPVTHTRPMMLEPCLLCVRSNVTQQWVVVT
jgi:hypothetical protein